MLRLALAHRPFLVEQLGGHAVVDQPALLLPRHVVVPRELGEAPVPRGHDLLSPGELVLGTTQGLGRQRRVHVLAPDRQQHLPDVDAGAGPLRLAVGPAHARLQPVGPGAREHLVDAEHVEGVDANPEVERVLAAVLDHVLVGGDAGGLHGLGADLLLLPGDQVHAVREEVDGRALEPGVEDADLGVRDATAEAGLGIGLVLDLPVAAGRACCLVLS